MPKTDRQIAEYMDYFRTAPKDERKWALDRLCEQEKKTPDEVRAICEQYKGINLRKGTPTPEDLKEKMKEKVKEGIRDQEIIDMYGISSNTVTRLKREMRESGEDLPKKRRQTCKTREKHPEAYPGQIYDDGEKVEPSEEIEEDVKVFIPGEPEEPQKIPYKKPQIIPPPTKPPFAALTDALNDFGSSVHDALFGREEPESGTAGECSQFGLWFALRDNLAEFLSGTFGKGTELTGESVEPDNERLVIRFKTADGKSMRCTLRAEGKHGK